LLCEGVFSKAAIWQSLPVTIRDAITLVRGLRIRYLWVDALCLVQNDPDDVAEGVAIMDLVYEMAQFTIVAACGHDANVGLPGVTPGTRERKRLALEVTEGVWMGVHVEIDQLLRRSVYETRAWTSVSPASGVGIEPPVQETLLTYQQFPGTRAIPARVVLRRQQGLLSMPRRRGTRGVP
jgi:hypothetical protein